MSDQDSFVPLQQEDHKHPYSKVLVVVILVLFFVTLLAQFRSTFKSYDKRVAGVEILSPAERAKNETDTLKKADTDNDQLSDYNELYLYHTSPYIRDTDSDGAPDGEEIKRGSDPLCQDGKDCSVNAVVSAAASSTAAQINADADAQIAAPASAPGATATAPQNFTPAQIREALIANGVPKEKVDTLTDEELLQLMEEAHAEAAKQQQ